MPTWVAVILSATLIWLGFVFWSQINFGSYAYALGYLRGDRLQVYPAVKSLGIRTLGEVLETTITLRNHGSTPVKVVGATSECSCMATQSMPATIPPGRAITLPVTIRFGNDNSDWRQSITFLTDDAHSPFLTAELIAQVESRKRIKNK